MDPGTARVDVWVWSVRLFKTRAEASAACKGGHVRVNGKKAKPALTVHVGDRVEALNPGGLHTVVVKRLIAKRVGATVAAACFEDHTPPPAPKEEAPFVPRRDRGAGRPTKRDRRLIDKLRRS
ncbi:MAG: RNA-binding S4 domain-containing protein [Aeromicrobium sp.]